LLAAALIIPACADDAAHTPAVSSTAAAIPLPPATDTVSPAIDGVVAAGTVVKVIGDGFNGTEGPIAHPDGSFLFTETRANRINRIDSDGNVTSFLENSNGSNALAFDSEGRLYAVQTTPGSMKIGVVYPPGREETLADNVDGKPFARPNDLVRSSSGHIYFTDFSIVNPAPEGTLSPAVYHIAPGAGKAVKVAEGIARPNGIQLTTDEKVLLVNDMWGHHLLAFDVAADGSISNRRNLAAYEGVRTDSLGAVNSGADGLAIDSQGRVYAATLAGVQVFSAQGQLLGIIPVSRTPQNIAFAGPAKKTLYVVGSGAAYKIQMVSQGFMGRAK
jgi:gluconolactonase